MPDSCECEDGTSISPEEELQDAKAKKNVKKARKQIKKKFKKCKPKSCTCPNGEVKPVTFFGCAKGGVPKCREEDEKPKLFCSDGSKVNPLKAVLSHLNGKCVCRDGKRPQCENGAELTCPNGELPDPSVSDVPKLFELCDEE